MLPISKAWLSEAPATFYSRRSFPRISIVKGAFLYRHPRLARARAIFFETSRRMRPTIAAASQLLLLLHLHCALCWTRQDFVDHLQISGANETYFPPIPGLPLDNIPTAWTNHIHFAVPQTTNKPQTTNHKPQTHKPQRVRSLHLFRNQFSTFPFRSGLCRL